MNSGNQSDVDYYNKKLFPQNDDENMSRIYEVIRIFVEEEIRSNKLNPNQCIKLFLKLQTTFTYNAAVRLNSLGRIKREYFIRYCSKMVRRAIELGVKNSS